MKIAVLGCGNMASAIVKGIHQKDKSVEFFTFTPSSVRAQSLATEVSGKSVTNLLELTDIDFWMLGFKPQQLNDFVSSYPGLLKNQNIISMLAATSVDTLSSIFESKNIYRVMPNTPVAINEGITLLYQNLSANKDSGKNVLSLFNYLGLTIQTDSEEQFNNLTVISGSGPAYVYYFLKQYIDAAIKYKLDPILAKKMVTQLFVGASNFAQSSDLSLHEMISAVTSKGGVTIEAIKKLQEDSTENTIAVSLEKAVERSTQISNELANRQY